MGTSEQRQHGFTLIEVMLFLGITSALAIGVLASSSFAINQQRYRDAVNSLQSLIQHQYNEASNVVNDRGSGDTEKDRKCGPTGITTKEEDNITDPEDRGTSECLVMGRLMTITGGKDITISSVVGYKDPAVAANTSDDIAALQQYTFFVSKADTEKNEIAWSGTATIRDASGPIAQTNPFAILILRSPLTGANHTFVFQNAAVGDQINSADIAITKMVERKICIDPGPFTISQSMGVIIRANAASASSIELSGDGAGC